MNIKLVHKFSDNVEKKYIELLNNSKYSTNFHSLSFLYLIKSIRKDLDLKFYVLYDKLEIIAIMPFFQKKYLSFTLSSLPYGCYGGFIYEDKNRDELFTFLSKFRYKLFTTINSYSDNIYTSKYFNVTNYSTWIIKCENSYDDFFTKLHHKTRNQIRKAHKSNVVIQNIETIQELNQVYVIYEKLILKHKIRKPYPKKLFIELLKMSVESNEVIFQLSIVEDKITAYSIFLNNNNKIFYWLNASHPDLQKFNGTNAILDNIIKYSYDNNIKEVNLGAVPYGNDGLHHFKTRWNAKEVSYNSYSSKIYKIKRIIFDKLFSK